MRLTLIRAAKAQKTLLSKDFFGIADLTPKDISGIVSGTRLPDDKGAAKYEALSVSRNKLENEECKIHRDFGRIRFDQDNQPRTHGQFELENEKKLYDTIDIKQKFVPDGVESEQNFTLDEPPASRKSNTAKILKETKRLFESAAVKLGGKIIEPTDMNEAIIHSSQKIDKKPALVHNPLDEQLPLHEIEPLTDEYYDRHMDSLKEFKFDPKLDEQFSSKAIKESKPRKGSDYLKDIRAQRVEPTAKGLKHRLQEPDDYSEQTSTLKLDSRGFNVLTNQVPNFDHWKRDDILEHIRKNVIYNNYDLLAINKPYGISSHQEGGKGTLDMNSLVTEIAASMRINKIYLCHRLDKSTTGVLMFATSQERAKYVAKLFKSDEIKKTYLCITAGVPNPRAAIIDIPIGIFSVAGKARCCLAPEKFEAENQLSKKFREARRAITEYNVLSEHKCAALVEVKPRTGVKHQIRCHMSFALGKTILGDHKYSHPGKVAPQVLPKSILSALNLRQSKARTVPMHLHSKTIVVPGAKGNGETLFIHAPVPSHFYQNLQTLKLITDEDVRKLVIKK